MDFLGIWDLNEGIHDGTRKKDVQNMILMHPKCSMYGIFTYIDPCSTTPMYVNMSYTECLGILIYSRTPRPLVDVAWFGEN